MMTTRSQAIGERSLFVSLGILAALTLFLTLLTSANGESSAAAGSSLTPIIAGRQHCPDSCNTDNCSLPACALCEFSCGGRCNHASHHNQPEESSLFVPENVQSCEENAFTNITSSVFSAEPQWTHYPSPARPVIAETAPVFADINEDGIYDWLLSSHQTVQIIGFGHMKEGHLQYTHAEVAGHADSGGDRHGQSLIDITGDGELDLFISAGGGLGGMKGPGNSNQLFWGPLLQTTSGAEIDAARAAGLSNSAARGRHSLWFDFNHDGFLDVLLTADRPILDYLAPSKLMLGTAGHEFTASPIMEYSKVAMISDVDGDGLAQELIIARDHCWPQAKPPYSRKTHDFCRSRPVGTTAVYKFDAANKKIMDIGKIYKPALPLAENQPACCKPGRGDTFNKENNNCYARSMVSADLDGDLLADQVILLCSQLRFYFSSDRSRGILPFGGQHIGQVLSIPANCNAKALRVADFDNNGFQEILLACYQPGKWYMIVSDPQHRKLWSVADSCLSSSDLSHYTEALPTVSDFEQACVDGADNPGRSGVIAEQLCGNSADKILIATGLGRKQRAEKYMNAELSGLSVVDINNDGALDVVSTVRYARMQFFLNATNKTEDQNRFISFRVIDKKSRRTSPKSVGMRLILTVNACEGCDKQFREISSFQSAPDKHGYLDDRILFGLGPEGVPVDLSITFSNGNRKHIDLTDWQFTDTNAPIDIVL